MNAATRRDGIKRWVWGAVLVAVFLGMRLPNLGRFVTADEGLWLREAGSFYAALKQGQLADTHLSSHPGTTTLWAGAAAYQVVFPEFGDANYVELSDSQWRQAIRAVGLNPVELLAVGRLVIVLAGAIALAVSWRYAAELVGPLGAGLGLGLLTIDPFATAHQRLLHQDGLMSAFMLVSILAFAAGSKSNSRGDFAISGVAAGLSWLTKSPALMLAPVLLGYGLWQAVSSSKRNTEIRVLAANGLIWLASGALVFFLLLPAMWVNSGQVVSDVFLYALGSAEGDYSANIFFNGVVYLDGDLGAAGYWFYPISFLWRSMPLFLVGLGLAAFFSLRKAGKESSQLLLLSLAALFFALLMTLATKKFDRYLLPTHFMLFPVSGWGLAMGLRWISPYWRKEWLVGLVALAFGWQAYASGTHAPYFLSYYNPLLGGTKAAVDVMQMGWGEGLDQAANYLNHEGRGAEVAAWYSTTFNLLYEGSAAHIPIAASLPEDDLAELLAQDYLVIYVHQWQRQTPANLLAGLEALEPVYVVELGGLEYARIYQPKTGP